MNYIGEITAFERWLENHPLDVAPQLLMYKFYKLANKAGWAEWVSVDNLTLMAEMKTKREATVIAWRDKLIEVGRIEYRKGKKGKPNQYRIIPLYTTLSEVQSVAQSEVKGVIQSVVQTVAKTADLYKHKTKTNILSSELSEPDKRKGFEKDSVPYKAAEYMTKRIERHTPTFPQIKPDKRESTIQRWAGDIDKLLRIDGVDEEEFRAVLQFSQTDPFWQKNILSGKKLREQYGAMLVRMQEVD